MQGSPCQFPAHTSAIHLASKMLLTLHLYRSQHLSLCRNLAHLAVSQDGPAARHCAAEVRRWRYRELAAPRRPIDDRPGNRCRLRGFLRTIDHRLATARHRNGSRPGAFLRRGMERSPMSPVEKIETPLFLRARRWSTPYKRDSLPPLILPL